MLQIEYPTHLAQFMAMLPTTIDESISLLQFYGRLAAKAEAAEDEDMFQKVLLTLQHLKYRHIKLSNFTDPEHLTFALEYEYVLPLMKYPPLDSQSAPQSVMNPIVDDAKVETLETQVSNDVIPETSDDVQTVVDPVDDPQVAGVLATKRDLSADDVSEILNVIIDECTNTSDENSEEEFPVIGDFITSPEQIIEIPENLPLIRSGGLTRLSQVKTFNRTYKTRGRNFDRAKSGQISLAKKAIAADYVNKGFTTRVKGEMPIGVTLLHYLDDGPIYVGKDFVSVVPKGYRVDERLRDEMKAWMLGLSNDPVLE